MMVILDSRVVRVRRHSHVSDIVPRIHSNIRRLAIDFQRHWQDLLGLRLAFLVLLEQKIVHSLLLGEQVVGK